MVLKAQLDRHQASLDGLLADSGTPADSGISDDVPILPDTQVEIPSPNLIKYQASASAGDAVRFYQAEMPRNEWAAHQKHLIRPNLAVLSYVKDGKRATIIIHQDDELRTRVVITMGCQASG